MKKKVLFPYQLFLFHTFFDKKFIISHFLQELNRKGEKKSLYLGMGKMEAFNLELFNKTDNFFLEWHFTSFECFKNKLRLFQQLCTSA